MRCIKIRQSGACDYAWRSLRRFHDTASLVDMLMQQRQIPQKQKVNVEKQMRQLSYCLHQAQDFAKSARTSSLSTRSLLAYYSLTALANVEILWHGDGNASIDKRPSIYHSHGLELVAPGNLGDVRARPQVDGAGKVKGLFGLWREHAHHIPHYGEIETIDEETGIRQTGLEQFSSKTALRDFSFPQDGISLNRCLGHIPSMQITLGEMRRDTHLARGRIKRTATVNSHSTPLREEVKTIIHPTPLDTLNEVGERFRYPGTAFEDIEIKEMPNGFIINHRMLSGNEYNYLSQAPEAFNDSIDMIYFVGSGEILNEFGYYYVGTYILGMISRYHPNVWMAEIGRNSDYAALADEFLEIALDRCPLLIASSLRDAILLYDG